jgi:hypothetical protein
MVFLATPNEANAAVVNAVAATTGITAYWKLMASPSGIHPFCS